MGGSFTRRLNEGGTSGSFGICVAQVGCDLFPSGPVCVLIAEAAVPVLFRFVRVPLLCVSKWEWDTHSSIRQPRSVFTIGEPHLDVFPVLHRRNGVAEDIFSLVILCRR